MQGLLARGQLRLRVGPYTYSMQSRVPLVLEGLRTLYADYFLAPENGFADYGVTLDSPGPLSRLQRKVEFLFDHKATFGLVPTRQAYAYLEWGMNWCVSVHANEYLKLHAAVVARGDRAIVMPGVPGAGKSTLCAALGLSGWRVLSDEHALVPTESTTVVPVCRPVSLKNQSIQVIRAFSSKAVFGPASEDTHKGTVAHMKADLHPDSHRLDPLPVTAMVFPRYSTADKQMLTRRSRSKSFVLAAYHSFNYSLFAAAGYHSMVNLIDAIECYDLVYHDLDWAIKSVEQLHAGQAKV